MGDDPVHRQLMAYMNAMSNQPGAAQPAPSQFLPAQPQPAPAFANEQFAALTNMFNQQQQQQARPLQPNMFGAPPPPPQQQQQPQAKPMPNQPQMTQAMLQQQQQMRTRMAQAAAANAGPSGAQGQQLHQLMQFMQTQSPAQPPHPPRFPGQQPPAMNTAMLDEMIANGSARNQAQAQQLLNVNAQRRGGALPSAMPVGTLPSHLSAGQPPYANPSTGQASVLSAAQQGQNAIAIFVRSQQQLKGLNNRVRMLETCLQSGISIVPPNPDGSMPMRQGGQLTASDRQQYETQIQKDRAMIASLQANVTQVIRQSGGYEAMQSQAQAYMAAMSQQQQQQQQPPPPPQQQDQFQYQQQPMANQPPMQQVQQRAQAAPPRPPSSAANVVRTASPSIAPSTLPTQQRWSADHIRHLYQTFGITSNAFERAFTELTGKGTVPRLQQMPTINGREISLYELLKAVLSHGGCDALDANQQWPVIANGFSLFEGVPTEQVARDIVGQLSTLYQRFIRPFEQIWAATLTQRAAQARPPPPPNTDQATTSVLPPAGQPVDMSQTTQYAQQHMARAAHTVNRTATPPVGRSAPPAAQPLPSIVPIPAPAQSVAAPTPANASAAATRPLRMPSAQELQQADRAIRTISEEVAKERVAMSMNPIPGLDDGAKRAIREAVLGMAPIVKKLKELLPLYYVMAGQTHAPAVKRYLVLVCMYMEQAQGLERDTYLLTEQQLTTIKDTFTECLNALVTRIGANAHFLAPRPAGSTPTLGADPAAEAADRDSIFASLQPGLRREDLKPPPVKHRRTMSQTTGESPAGASPAKSVATPEGASPPKTPGNTAVAPAARGARGAGRARGGRGRGAASGHSRLASSSAVPTGSAPAQPPVVDMAEQRRRQEAAARADPTTFASDAFARLQAAEAGAGLGGLAGDLSRQFGFALAEPTTMTYAPVVPNPPPMPTLSSAAPSWPIASTSNAPASTKADAAADDELFTLYLSADAYSSPPATTPELVTANGGVHESPKDADELDTPQNSAGGSIDVAPSGRTVPAPSSLAGGSEKRKREEALATSSPKPDLGFDFDWDQLESTMVDWSALVAA